MPAVYLPRRWSSRSASSAGRPRSTAREGATTGATSSAARWPVRGHPSGPGLRLQATPTRAYPHAPHKVEPQDPLDGDDLPHLLGIPVSDRLLRRPDRPPSPTASPRGRAAPDAPRPQPRHAAPHAPRRQSGLGAGVLRRPALEYAIPGRGSRSPPLSAAVAASGAGKRSRSPPGPSSASGSRTTQRETRSSCRIGSGRAGGPTRRCVSPALC